MINEFPEHMYSWFDWPYDYSKDEHDVLLRDGTVLLFCWPNAGCIRQGYNRDGKWVTIDQDQIAKVRLSRKWYHEYVGARKEIPDELFEVKEDENARVD